MTLFDVFGSHNQDFIPSREYPGAEPRGILLDENEKNTLKEACHLRDEIHLSRSDWKKDETLTKQIAIFINQQIDAAIQSAESSVVLDTYESGAPRRLGSDKEAITWFQQRRKELLTEIGIDVDEN